MEANVKLSNSNQTFFDKVKKALKNETFLYILKRILSSCFTAILIIADIGPASNFFYYFFRVKH